MPLYRKTPAALDFDAIGEASAQLEALTERLPADALQAFANEVVGRLSANARSRKDFARPVSREQVEQLCEALVAKDPDAGALMISDIEGEGTSVAEIYLLYLAAAARRLGEKWVSDDLTFFEVTIGTSRILAIMRSMGHALRAERTTIDRFAVFASVPGEQHTIGIAMASDLFRRDGWEIELLIGLAHEEILDKIAESDALVVGLTAHGVYSIGALIRLIAGIRIVNPAVYILVSGHFVEEADDVVKLTGADGFAADIPTALKEAKRLLTLARA